MYNRLFKFLVETYILYPRQGSILRPLLFLIFVNDLSNSTKILDPVLFADDTKLFCSDNNIRTLFETANQELSQINDWFLANKLSLNLKFLGIIFDEHLTWKKHIQLIENKVSKNVGVLYKASKLINSKCLRRIYFSFIHSYINYANIAWVALIELI